LRQVGAPVKSVGCYCTKTWQQAVYGLQSADFRVDRNS
jgi:hypothetical protein